VTTIGAVVNIATTTVSCIGSYHLWIPNTLSQMLNWCNSDALGQCLPLWLCFDLGSSAFVTLLNYCNWYASAHEPPPWHIWSCCSILSRSAQQIHFHS
jgi:hypothetical protein